MASNIISKLNACLQSEMAAVETYDQALEKVKDPTAQHDLKAAQKSHADRVQQLTDLVIECGGEPKTSSGLKGVAAKAAEGTAKLFGEKSAIAVLEEGEDKGLGQYKDLLQEPEAELRDLARQMLPKQEETHNLISRLQNACEMKDDLM